ncbi:MAG: hypothetical protein A2848_02865 [Candidatus Magasanikbacteria bacterium RIFCSPHIGHO2_01_FULL_50_8]|uniref:YokE-like PH domain-containing protein n=2 Tax=Candidatus Magasanikiibacteriota TaxID=1752731 RepID=A0A1F6LNX2_9BACT|nr:MAG: hypothetical protein A2848_02865 [Candidatus Magasanikbacteria bacterium RIFCSPHIGHO2_01_FULL_50_8]OGH67641.1 MAG: hypothetical protein A3C15_02365 [Candidatus Magasanikbacteria bacterium RIFCSPHIGHO2_02_FULL_50_9b]
MGKVDNIELKPQEKIVREIRRFPFVHFGTYCGATLLMLIPFFFLFPLMKLHTWGVALGVVVFCAGAYIFLRTFYLWYHNVFVITTDRIIDFDQRGFFERVVSQSSWEKIQDISVHIHGASQTFFHYGDVNIKTAWGSVDLCVPSIFRPNNMQRLMLETQENFLKTYERRS